MSLDDEPAGMGSEEGGAAFERPVLRVLRPSDEELAEHDRVLQDIVKATKGLCLWIPPEPASEAPAA